VRSAPSVRQTASFAQGAKEYKTQSQAREGRGVHLAAYTGRSGSPVRGVAITRSVVDRRRGRMDVCDQGHRPSIAKSSAARDQDPPVANVR
jgi:hypothetical protein